MNLVLMDYVYYFKYLEMKCVVNVIGFFVVKWIMVYKFVWFWYLLVLIFLDWGEGSIGGFE